MSDHGLSPEQHAAVRAGRRALAEAIEAEAPEGSSPMALCVVAIALGFADICAASRGAGDLIEVINGQIRGAGIEVVPVRRN